VTWTIGFIKRCCEETIAEQEKTKLVGGEGRIPSAYPKKFSVAVVRKSFVVNEQIVEKPFCQCCWKICEFNLLRES
jgi:hypothetical protein